MRKMLALLVPVLVMACSLFTKSNAKTALNVVDEACVLEHAFLDEATINEVCKIEQDLSPAVHDLVGAARMASSAGACVGSGAPPSSSAPPK